MPDSFPEICIVSNDFYTVLYTKWSQRDYLGGMPHW